MDESVFQQPTPEQLAGFVVGDPLATDEIVRLLLPQLCRWAWQQYPRLPDAEVQSTLHQVLAETCVNHARYDPTKAKLTTYLIRLLRLRLADLHRQEQDLRLTEEYGEDTPENQSPSPYNPIELSGVETRQTQQQFFETVTDRLEPVEREFLRLMRQGEKAQQVYVAVLHRYGFGADAAHEVKNTKERLMRKLKAFAREHHYQLEDLLGD